MVSEFIYACGSQHSTSSISTPSEGALSRPPQQDSIFQLKMILQPTVNITEVGLPAKVHPELPSPHPPASQWRHMIV